MEAKYAKDWREERTLEDGTPVLLRLLRADDRPILLSAFERLSPSSRYLRFFTAMSRLPESVVDELMREDENHVAIVATSVPRSGGTPEGFGVARCIRLPGSPDVAEAAVTVVDHMQRRGLGSLLLQHLVDAAREHGIRTFRAEVLRSNPGIHALLHEVDESARPVETRGAVVVYLLDLGREPAGPLFGLLRLAARGLDVLVRHLPGWAMSPSPRD